MRDHGAEPVLDPSSDDLESKLESIIRELRTVMKESIAEGGQYAVDLTRRPTGPNPSRCRLEMEMFLNSVMSLILAVPEDKINRPILNFSEAIVNGNLPEKYGPMKIRV
jgi:hypothetical protein